MRANAESCPFLTQRLHIEVLPTMVLIKNGKVDYQIVGLDEVGGEKMTTSRIAWALGQHGIIDKAEDVKPPSDDDGESDLD